MKTNVEFPVLLLNKKYIEDILLGVAIGKEKISLSQIRYESQIPLIGMDFCDSQGRVIKLTSIQREEKDKSFKNWLFNGFKFPYFYSFLFRDKHEKLDINEVREIAIEYMRIENIPEAFPEAQKYAQEARSIQEIIDWFFFGRLD